MAVMKRYGNWYLFFRPFKDKKIGIRLDTETKAEAKGIETMLTRACRTGNYSTLDHSAKEACVRMFANQNWEVPQELSGISISEPSTILTLWKGVELCLTYPGIRDASNRERLEQAFSRVVGYFGKDYPVKELWIPHVKEYQIVRLREGAAPATINREKASLSKMFQVLVELRHLEVNPCHLVKPLSEKQAKREVYIGYEDFVRILSCLPDFFVPIAQTAYYTGMRKGEILGLTRDRVKLDHRMILLGSEHTKEALRKRVPIHEDLLPILQRVMKVTALGCSSVFHRDGDPITHKDQVRWCWDRKVIKVGLDPFPHFHDLRHTWKTNARRSGMHPEIEKAIMGHAERGKTVHEGYGRISDLELVQAIDLVTFDHGETEIWVSGKKNPVAATAGLKTKR